IRPGAARALQESLFGAGVNVAALTPRGATPALVAASLDAQGDPDWARAWTLFGEPQWIADIEAARIALVGANGKIELYGRSGGASLVVSYIRVHGDRVSRAFIQAPASPDIAADLHIAIDRFWSELGAQDPRLQTMLRDALARRPQER